jgi:hypothetical protein
MKRSGIILISCFLLCASLSCSGPSYIIPSATASKEQTSLQSSFWGFYNSITIYPNGNATEGAPSYVQIISLEIRQIGQYVQFIWEGNGSLYNNDSQYYFIVFDTDLNSSTGQYWSGAGSELNISVYHEATLTYFDAKGNVIKELSEAPAIFEDNRFYLNIEKDEIPSDTFYLYFECSGGTPYGDEGSLNLVTLQPSRPELKMLIGSDNVVLAEKPTLINIPHKNTPVQLRTYLISGENKTELPKEDLIYMAYHPVKNPSLGDPSSIISVDENGTATYLREGYVFVTSYSKESHLNSEPAIITTGNVYGNPKTDSVIAVFPEDYRPNGSAYSFGDMMNSYPNYIKTVSIAYNLEREMYDGYKPFNGDRQILALLVMNGYHNGGNNNPLETAPEAYMDSSNGEPNYIVVVHEMDHNFAETIGMQRLTSVNDSRIGKNGFNEAVASLPVEYLAKDLHDSPEKYGLTRDSFEWRYYAKFLNNNTREYKHVPLEGDISYSKYVLNDFEGMITRGETTGIFDNNGTFDGTAVFCSLFQQYVYGFTNGTNPYKQEVIRRFLSLFSDEEPIDFRENEVETYFAACFSAAVGHDIKEKLRFWGFSINETYYDQVYPELRARVDLSVTKREFYIMINDIDHTVTVRSNSTVAGFAFDQINKQVLLNLAGNDGETGYCNVTIPGDLFWGNFLVSKDGARLVKDIDYTQVYNGTHYTFCFAYHYSSHTFVIEATYVAAEFSSLLLLPLFMVATLFAAVILKKRKHSQRPVCASR